MKLKAGSFHNQVFAQSAQPVPEVGMGATILYYTDRKAATVVVVYSPKLIQVRTDKAIRTDKNGMSDSQSYDYQPDPDGVHHWFSLRKNGKWVMKGESMTNGTPLALGFRREYHDYSF